MIGNIFEKLPADTSRENFEDIFLAPNMRVERIVSNGQATPPGNWYDQDWDEWVIVLQGSAGVRLDDQAEIIGLQPGDYIYLKAHHRHRVEWTDPAEPTIWLALHFTPEDTDQTRSV